MSETAPEEDSGGLCCQGCSPTARKCGYYITFILGLFLFCYGVFELLSANVYWLIGGSLIVLFCPLWVKNCKACFMDFKNALKITSAIIFIIFLGGTIACTLLTKEKYLSLILGICLGISGIWYFLSFFPGGQKGCVDCIKSCCCKSSEA